LPNLRLLAANNLSGLPQAGPCYGLLPIVSPTARHDVVQGCNDAPNNSNPI
jgi:hypothetical protein